MDIVPYLPMYIRMVPIYLPWHLPSGWTICWKSEIVGNLLRIHLPTYLPRYHHQVTRDHAIFGNKYTASTHWRQQDSPRMKHGILSLRRGLPVLSPIHHKSTYQRMILDRINSTVDHLPKILLRAMDRQCIQFAFVFNSHACPDSARTLYVGIRLWYVAMN